MSAGTPSRSQPGRSSTGAGCDCLDRINEQLALRNSVIMVTFYPVVRPIIETAKIDNKKRGRPMLAVASFCPFCGTKYDVEASPEGPRP